MTLSVGDRVDSHAFGRMVRGTVRSVGFGYSAWKGEDVTTVEVEWSEVAHGEERYTRHELSEFTRRNGRAALVW